MASVDEVADWMTTGVGREEVACTKTLYEVVTPVAVAQVTCVVVDAVKALGGIVQVPERMPVWRVPTWPTLNPVAVVEARVVFPVTLSVLPSAAAPVAVNAPTTVEDACET